MTRGSTILAALPAALLGLLPGGPPVLAQSAPPDLLTYQGTLADSAGTPLTGNFAMAFRFFDAGVGGTLLLTDTHAAVGATEGLYTVLLGSGTITAGAEAALSGVFRNRAAVFLEVEISGQTLSPRVRITAQGYALNAGSLEGRPASDFIDGTSASQTIGGNLTITGTLTSNGGITAPGGITGLPAPAAASDAATRDYVDTSVAAVTGNFIQNQVIANQAAGFRITGNGLFNGGSVGIGTTAPGFNLQVVGTADPAAGVVDGVGAAVESNFIGRRARGTPGAESAVLAGDNLAVFQGRGFGATAYSAGGRARIEMKAAQNWTDAAQGTDLAFFTTASGTAAAAERVRITQGGRVGIGTAAPTTLLHVVSTTASMTFPATDLGDIGIQLVSPVVGHAPALSLKSTAALGRIYRVASFSDGVSPGFRIRDDTASADRLVIDAGGSVGINTGTEYGSGNGVVGLANATTVPSTNPAGGGVLYAEGGVLKWRRTDGTIDVFGAATASGAFPARLQADTPLAVSLQRCQGDGIEVNGATVFVGAAGIAMDVTDNLIDAAGADAGGAVAASTLYYVYVSNASATTFPSDLRASATAPSSFNGVKYLGAAGNAANWRFVGWVRTTAGPVFEDNDTNRLVVNYYHRRPARLLLRPGYVDNNSEDSYTMSNTSWAAVNGGAGASGSYISNGEDEVSFDSSFSAFMDANAAGGGVGIGDDTTTTAVVAQVFAGGGSSISTTFSGGPSFHTTPAEGYRTVSLLAVVGSANMNLRADIVRAGGASDSAVTYLAGTVWK